MLDDLSTAQRVALAVIFGNGLVLQVFVLAARSSLSLEQSATVFAVLLVVLGALVATWRAMRSHLLSLPSNP